MGKKVVSECQIAEYAKGQWLSRHSLTTKTPNAIKFNSLNDLAEFILNGLTGRTIWWPQQ